MLAPKCGVTTTLSSSNNGEDLVGSATKTSIAAPAIVPLPKACAKSDSLMIPPRATLIILNDGLANASILVSIKFTVCLFFGKCIVKISDCAITSSIDIISTFSSRARSAEINGSKAIIRMSKASARCATSAPIRPRPNMPRVLEASSIPSHLLRSQRP
ncbi:unannotated protein [freshwater metagenome]|uniref:Unannotated protein n=1 Tax=freshwater metagenome TaxID=449393 RepID=A0A6J7P6S3_9ZZZZ